MTGDVMLVPPWQSRFMDALDSERAGCEALADDSTDEQEARTAGRRAVLIGRLIEDLKDLDENGW